MFTSGNLTNSCSSFNTKRSIDGFIMNEQRVRKTEKKNRGKVVRITYRNTTITKTKSWMYTLNTFSAIHSIRKIPPF